MTRQWLLCALACMGCGGVSPTPPPAERVESAAPVATSSPAPSQSGEPSLELATSDGEAPDAAPDAYMAFDMATDAATIGVDASDSGVSDAPVDSAADTTPDEASACVPVAPPRGCIMSPPCANATNPGLGGGILIGQLCSARPIVPSNCTSIPLDLDACGTAWVLCCWVQ